MIIEKTKFDGLYVIMLEKIVDNRGFFARSFCKHEFADSGIVFECKQCNYSFNKARNTLRGMHFQREPYLEDKIVTCINGSVFDVVIDLRKDSCTYLEWQGFELSSKSYQSIFIPKGFAHGFMTLEDNTCMYYQMSEYYHKGYEDGIRYDDPKVGIKWPEASEIILSDKDKLFPYL